MNRHETNSVTSADITPQRWRSRLPSQSNLVARTAILTSSFLWAFTFSPALWREGWETLRILPVLNAEIPFHLESFYATGSQWELKYSLAIFYFNMHHNHMLMISFCTLKMQHILLLCTSEILVISVWLSVLPSHHLHHLSHRPKYLDSLKSITLRQICYQKIIVTFL